MTRISVTRMSILTVLMLTAVPVAAQVPATPEGAARIEAGVRQVFGTMPGVVTVEPQGATYALTVDVGPLLGLIPMPGMVWEAAPYTVTLTDNGDGTWTTREEGPFSLRGSMGDTVDVRYTIGAVSGGGIWDERLKTYTEYRGALTDVKITTRARGADGVVLMDDGQAFRSAVVEIASRPAADGAGVDGEMQLTYTDYAQRITLPEMRPGVPPTVITARALDYRGPIRFEGMRVAEIFDLVAFFVARPDPGLIVADQETMRGLIGAALPLFGRMEFEAVLDDLAVDTPAGTVVADSARVEIGMNGAVADGRLREAIEVSGLALPPGLLPSWAESLVPERARIDFQVSDFDLAAPADALLRNFDLTTPDVISPNLAFGLLGGLLPRGQVRIALLPSRAEGAGYAVEARGEMLAGPIVQPSGSGRVVATGIDAVIAALSAANDPDAGQAAAGLDMARGLGRDEGGAMVWDLEFTPAGRVIVNGRDVTDGPL